MDQMKLGHDSDNYSDEDFYSDEFEEEEHEEADRDDHNFDLDETVQKKELNELVGIYQRYLDPEEDSHTFEEFQMSESFKHQQQKVQQAYGNDTEIYKTLNPKHSQAQILP